MQITVKQLSKSYKDKTILDNVTFTIESGTVCGLLGVNGAGKSTLMKILFGLLPKSSGEIQFDGVPEGKQSLGMKQRLGIGMAILTDPQFLILDEPTNGLDPEGINELLDLIRSLKAKGMTILVSSHQLLEISKVADHILILDKGKIQYDGENKNVDSLERLFFKIVHGGY